MKTKKVLAAVLSLLMTAMLFTACGAKEPETLESYINSNSEAKQELDKAIGGAEEKGITVDINGNEIIYNCDLSAMDGMSDELAKSDTLKESLQTALEGQGDLFKNIAKEMSDDADIEGVSVTVNYTYGDEVIATATFVPDAEE